MPGVERYNLSGRNPKLDDSDLSPQRSEANRLNTQQDVESNDARWAQRAGELNNPQPPNRPDPAGARAAAENIIDPDRRISVFQELFPGSKDMTPPGEIFEEGFTGISDPLALFFMMVLYLDKPAPTVNWNDILRAARASDAGNDAFALLPNNDDGYMSQRVDFTSKNAPIVDSTKQIQVPTGGKDADGNDITRTTTLGQRRTDNLQERDAAAAAAAQTSDEQKQRNAENKFTNGQWNPTRGDGANGVVVWPIQNMPTADGVSKSVDWDTIKIMGGADPIIANNHGADNVELNLDFTYAVGIPGIGQGDGETTEQSDNKNSAAVGSSGGAGAASATNFWTVEDVMGVMYLASSLVYPFKAISPLLDDDGKPAKQTPGANQFPVIFLRHYSLFPFLTPFVVKSVRIEPDEDQPLIITNPQRMNAAGTHLSFPAVRQVVRIKITLLSAHNYITLFSEKDPNGQLAIQTSGQTYRNLAATLLGGRI